MIFSCFREAFPLVLKIAQGGVTVDTTRVNVLNLLSIYDGLIRHWTCIDQLQNLLVTLAEATAAAIAIEMHEKVTIFSINN